MSSPFQWSSNWYNNAYQNRSQPGQNQQVQLDGGQANPRASWSNRERPLSSMFGPSTLQNFQNRMPQQGMGPTTQQGMGGGFSQQLSQWMQQTPMAYGQGQQGQQQNMSQLFGQGGQQGTGGVRAGDFLSEAFARDFANQANFRQQQNQLFQGLAGGLQSVPAMGMMGVDMANQAGQRGMDIARDGLNSFMQQAQQAGKVAKDTRNQTRSAMGAARQGMQAGIDEMQGAINQHDFFRKDTVASGISGVQAQFAQARNSIMSNQNMSEEQKSIELDNLNNTMRQQAASYASQADSQAAESLLQARNVLAGMKQNMGSVMGGLGMQAAGLNSSTGMQAAGMGLQAAQAGYQLMNAQSQFSASLAQSAMAQAMQASLAGNNALAEMYKNIGGPLNIADTVLAMMNAQGARPGTQLTANFGGRIGGLMGQTNFAGYEDQRQQQQPSFQMPQRFAGSMF